MVENLENMAWKELLISFKEYPVTLDKFTGLYFKTGKKQRDAACFVTLEQPE